MSKFISSPKDFFEYESTGQTEEEVRQYLEDLSKNKSSKSDKMPEFVYDFGDGITTTSFEDLSADISRPGYEIRERFLKTRNIYLTMLSFRQEEIFRKNAQYILGCMDCMTLLEVGFDFNTIVDLVTRTVAKRRDLVQQIQNFLKSATLESMTFNSDSLSILFFTLSNKVATKFYEEAEWRLVDAVRSLVTQVETDTSPEDIIKELYEFSGNSYENFMDLMNIRNGMIRLTKAQVELLLDMSNSCSLTSEQATEIFLSLYQPYQMVQTPPNENDPVLEKKQK